MSENTVHTYAVTGMTCGHCVGAVRQEVGALTGVTDVHVELATGDVTVDQRPAAHPRRGRRRRSTRPATSSPAEPAPTTPRGAPR